ncbi:MAG: pyrimidine 5'-nucleotidase [Betaproteobacteria bacterium]|jgi:putative hydrolase of the HAD superfamily|nr:MAG: 5'-nucleotidase [Betaproteobacteria bacterium SG8_41]UCF74568.1 MAG: pyrimidine 5'-nucleotidase [Betaproteobacteria bacterium]
MWRHAWIFDLDNTLHNASPHIFPHINQAMNAYLQAHLGLDEAAAGELRRHYWLRYGATLLGLMRHHATDPRHFLWHTHQFPALDRMLVREPQLRATIRRLPGRKYVFSNSPVHYSRAVLRALSIADLFHDVFSIEQTRYRPKPDTYGFLRLCRVNHLKPHRCIMVEDSVENLRTAKRLGMKTVWVTRAARMPEFVDVGVPSLMQLPRRLTYLQ